MIRFIFKSENCQYYEGEFGGQEIRDGVSLEVRRRRGEGLNEVVLEEQKRECGFERNYWVDWKVIQYSGVKINFGK